MKVVFLWAGHFLIIYVAPYVKTLLLAATNELLYFHCIVNHCGQLQVSLSLLQGWSEQCYLTTHLATLY